MVDGAIQVKKRPGARLGGATMRLLPALLLTLVGSISLVSCKTVPGRRTDSSAPQTKPVVRIDLFLMATCPFALAAFRGLVPVLTEFDPLVQLELHHIGGVLTSGKLDSMYGEDDLVAGRRQACAAELGGTAGLLRVLQCQLQDANGADGGCTTSDAIDSTLLGACMGGAQGEALLRASVERSRKQGQRASPAIFINDEPYRGGYSPRHFADALCSNDVLAEHSYCQGLPPTVDVEITIVSDSNDASQCEQPTQSCDVAAFRRFAEEHFVGARVRVIPAASQQGASLRKLAAYPALPFAILSPSARDDAYGFRAVQNHLRLIEGDPRFFLPLAAQPSAEQASQRPLVIEKVAGQPVEK